MELVKTETPPTVSYVAKGGDDLVARESIKIKINQDTKFSVDVPDGKVWKVGITLRIQEFDA